MRECVYCKSHSVKRNGLRKNKSGWKRFYKCNTCGKQFTPDEGFNRYRHKPEVITAALDLRAKALSLAEVVDHLDQHHQTKVSRKTILDWENKFGKKLKSFTQSLNPEIDGDIHADEVFLKVGGKWNYFWDGIDFVTKFLVGDHLSQVRHYSEAEQFLTNIKENVGEQVWRIHTDNSFDYPLPIKKVFGKRVYHQHYPAWKKKFKNNPIERLHNTIKQRYKTFRGFCTVVGTQNFLDFWGVYYNFIRKHTSLSFKTPAQAAKIELNLGRNRWFSMIKRTWLIWWLEPIFVN